MDQGLALKFPAETDVMVKACNPSIQKVQHENRRECSGSHDKTVSKDSLFLSPLFVGVDSESRVQSQREGQKSFWDIPSLELLFTLGFFITFS